MRVHMPTFPNADRGIPKGGVAPIHSRKLRIGIAAPAAVVQPQGGRRHTEALSRTGNRGFRAHAPRCLMCARGSASTLATPVLDPSSGSRR